MTSIVRDGKVVQRGSPGPALERRLCAKCSSRGYYPEPYGPEDQWGVQDVRERYCSCAAGRSLQLAEAVT